MPTTLIYGENEFACQSRLGQMIDDFKKANGSESINVFDGEESSYFDIGQTLESQSLFSSGDDLVVIKRIGSNNQLKDSLTDHIAEIPLSTKLILYEPNIDKRSRLFKQINKHGKMEQFTALDRMALTNWVEEMVKDRGGSIETSSAAHLIQRLQGSQMRISSEIDKLVTYDPAVTVKNIDLLVTQTPDDNIFDLLELVSRKDTKHALMKYDELRSAQIESHYILVMISWQLANLLLVKYGEDKTDREIASDAAMNPYVVGKTRSITSKLSRRKIKEMILRTINTDKRLKTTSVDPDQLIKQLIATL